jgi:hypothetical protein
MQNWGRVQEKDRLVLAADQERLRFERFERQLRAALAAGVPIVPYASYRQKYNPEREC